MTLEKYFGLVVISGFFNFLIVYNRIIPHNHTEEKKPNPIKNWEGDEWATFILGTSIGAVLVDIILDFFRLPN